MRGPQHWAVAAMKCQRDMGPYLGGKQVRWVWHPCWRRTGQVRMEPTPDQVRLEGQAHLERPCCTLRASRTGRSRKGKPRELRGGEQTRPSGGSGLVVARHGRVEESRRPQRRYGYAQIMLHLFVYILPRGLPLMLCWCLIGQAASSRETPFALGWPELLSSWPLRQSPRTAQL